MTSREELLKLADFVADGCTAFTQHDIDVIVEALRLCAKKAPSAEASQTRKEG